MDSLTQITLGAAAGEYVLGRKVGRKAAAWGAVIGTLPDLDNLAAPLLDAVQRLSIHRGYSHSFLCCVVAAPIIGRILQRLHHRDGDLWRSWSLLVLVVWGTHILLDCFTSFGTQAFLPFTNYKVAFCSVSVIDPFYTLPLGAGIIAALSMAHGSRRRMMANTIGLTASTFYLLTGLVIKTTIHYQAVQALTQQQIRYNRILTKPTPLNAVLWRIVVDTDDAYLVGYRSLLDKIAGISFRRIAKDHARLGYWDTDPAVQRLIWVTDGYYTIERKQTLLVFNDMRYGRIDAWHDGVGDFVFSYTILESSGNAEKTLSITENPRTFRMTKALKNAFVRRIQGQIDL